MANNKNLIPINKRTKSEQRELQSKAGKASGKSRRAKKAVKTIIEELLNSPVTDYPQTAKLAVKLGLDDDKSIKELVTIVCMLNTLSKGNIEDLERLIKILGEESADDDNNITVTLDWSRP